MLVALDGPSRAATGRYISANVPRSLDFNVVVARNIEDKADVDASLGLVTKPADRSVLHQPYGGLSD